MKTLLEFYLEYFDFLYLDPDYRITDSRTSGRPTIDAGFDLTGPVLNWSFNNDRGQLGFGVAPAALAKSPDNWFRISVIRQYLDGYDETKVVNLVDLVTWTRDNLGRIEELLSPDNAARSCEKLIDLEKSLADKYFGPTTT
jgi:hypothetical protein